ncbi:protein kinase domain-containing protein [Embleya sp. NBC_00896]|uniref:serine/threonine protein kinase n=1 Tax=Embleya sp. NBC_00896 TaxID=2975961 RepID=UPI002F909E80|nr:hypothetical protein OG928_40065 [Embleya sp. NBC_00896]
MNDTRNDPARIESVEPMGPVGPGGPVAAAGPVAADTLPPLPAGYTKARVLRDEPWGTTVRCRDGDDAEVVLTVLRVRPVDPRSRLTLHTELLAAATAARHACAAEVVDVGFTADDAPYLARRHHPGEVPRVAGLAGGLPVEDVLVVGVRLALALTAAHRRGVLHLGVHPDSLVAGPDGEVLLADLGLVHALRRAAPEAAPAADLRYAPRESAGWETPGPACDVYGLAATLYALLTGAPPHAAAAERGAAALYLAMLAGEVPALRRPDVPPALVAVLLRGLAAHPEDRPSMAELQGVLRALVPAGARSRLPEPDPEPDPVGPLGPEPAEVPYADDEDDDAGADRARRRRRWMLAIAASATVLFVGGAFALTQVRGKDDKPAAKPGPTAPAPVNSAPARLLSASAAQSFVVGDVGTAAFGDSVQVAWQPPRDATRIVGYLVLAVDASGAQLDRRQTPAGTANVVFATARVGTDACFTVASLVRTDDGSLGLAPAPAVCLAGRASASATPRGTSRS